MYVYITYTQPMRAANDYMPCTAAWSAARQPAALREAFCGDPMATEGSDMTPSCLQQLLEARRHRYLITLINMD